MKSIKIFSGLIAAMLLLTVPAVAVAKPSPRKDIKLANKTVVDKRTSAMNFSQIEVSRMVSLTIEERNDNLIVIRTDENLLPYVEVYVSDGKLTATVSKDINVGFKGLKGPLVEVSIPDNGRIESVETYGASSLNIESHLRVQKFNAEIYGASSFNGKVVAERARVKIYGASKSGFGFEGGQLDMEVSGASSVNADVNSVSSDINVYGAARLKINGSSELAKIDVSGASSFKGFDFATDVCSIEVSGASSAKINCRKSLSAESTGASSLVYSGECVLSHVASSGASSIKKQ